MTEKLADVDVDSLKKLPEVPLKRRAGLYMDVDLFNLVQKIAEVNGYSWNDVAVKLIRQGIQTLRSEG